ncbi:MAG: D-Ala-D-Ala carboxypeptidase family metallohydrolase [Ignavibacteria bacterium]|jgi:hypothetical protein
MNLSKHFQLSEFENSETAIKNNIDNAVPSNLIGNIRELCINILEPIREYHGALLVTSGYRTPELNALIGGSKNSQHMEGEAADIVSCTNLSAEMIYYIAMGLKLDYDQLIYERRQKNGEIVEWVHISYTTKRKNRNESFQTGLLNFKL